MKLYPYPGLTSINFNPTPHILLLTVIDSINSKSMSYILIDLICEACTARKQCQIEEFVAK
jgi:hypothetical protein